MQRKNVLNYYFTLPNQIFSLGLASGEIAVYAFLLYLEDRKTYQCHPSYKTIGSAVDMSQNTVRKYVMALEEHGLITTEPTSIVTKDGVKRNGNLRYTIRPISEALELFHQHQLA
ncbi:helix-turn-helix domain-containing protein [Bengtsoniella intestinalis]|uniref:helix-turn-helix domain-containing protein n=1 Tax=Bengtsoniella intestinalis TaxID=3073143 RepID=UPI00391F89F8